jgi:hypothetical protein
MANDKENSALTCIYLDGVRLDYEDTEDDATLGSLVKAIEDKMISSKRILSGLLVEGEEKVEWRTDEMLSTNLSKFKELKLESSSFEEFASRAISTLQEYIKVMLENIKASVTVLRRGETNSPELFLSILEGIAQIMSSVDELSRGMTILDVNTFKEDPSVYYAPLLKHMEALEEARAGGDSLLIADIMEYEILPILSDMDEKLFHSGTA